MVDPREWRFALAEKIGASYASNANARVVMIAGSVGRGSADRYSDIEVDVYYAELPTEAERIAPVERCDGGVELLAQDEDEWEEQMSFGGFPAHTSTFLIATMERYLREVIDECSLAPETQTRLFSLQHAVTVKGEDEVERWRAKAAAYPVGFSAPCWARTSVSGASRTRPTCVWTAATCSRCTRSSSRPAGSCSGRCSR